jgi:hypothetical protein
MALIPALKAYERHLSALAMLVGFVVDNFAFGRVDHPATQLVLATYLLTAAVSIILLHYFEERAEQKGRKFRWSAALSAVTQFAFGGLWSAFLIFYSRSAVVATSWPFLLILFCIFVGNEVFRDYRSRLVFTCILLFFALFSYATFVVPIFEGSVDTRTFLMSVCLSAVMFSAFLIALALLARSHIRRDFGKIIIGAGVIFVSLNAFYYMNLLPPLPLALVNADVLFSKEEIDRNYQGEPSFEPWYRRLHGPKNYRVAAGQPLYAYSAVFAPMHLKAQIVHEWEWYDDAASQWVTQTVITFPITGGRENGYRGYSYKSKLRPGNWRVDIETKDGRAMGRLNFSVQIGPARLQ